MATQKLLAMKRLTDFLPSSTPALVISLIALVLCLFSNITGGYGYFRDEFYYLACADNLAWGYVDHPPLSIALLWFNRLVFGDSVFALRLLPAIGIATLVYLTGLIVREIGGGRMAQWLACIVVVIAPVYLAISSFYSMNVFEPLFWMTAAYLLLRIINSGNQRLWILFGIVAGLGLQNKHSMLFFGFALLVGLILTAQWKQFKSKWFWLAGIIAGVIFLPNIFWQLNNDWATVEFMRNAQQWKNAPMSPLEFISAQVLFQHPFAFPLWLAGVFALFLHKDMKKYRVFGWIFIVLLVLFIVQRGKPYYLSPIYPVILSAGAVAFERFVTGKKWRWLPHAYIAIVILGGAVTLPIWLPVLPIETYVRYSNALGLQTPKMERHDDTVLPQLFADRFGWEEMVAEVAKIYNGLPEDEKTKTAIFTQNYGEAGAIDFFGRQFQLPKALSGHNNYWLWGLRGFSGETMIIVSGWAEEHRKVFESVECVAIHRHRYAMPFETNIPIYICKKPKQALQHIWKNVKHYI